MYRFTWSALISPTTGTPGADSLITRPERASISAPRPLA